jgi:tetratricopeptide (TPR) repeat protein
MKKWIIAAVVLSLLAGCQQKDPKASKKEVLNRWYDAREEVLCGLGNEHLKIGQLEDAAKMAREALAMDQDCVVAHVLLGRVHIEQGQYALAVKELTTAGELKPSTAEIHYLLGVAQEKNGDLEAALTSYRKTLELDSTCTYAILAIGEVLVEMDKVDDAMAYVEQNMVVARNQPGIYELAGRLAMMLEDYDKAVRYYQFAHDLDYTNACYLESLARVQFLARQYGPAVESLQTLAATEAYKNRAWVYLMKGECLLALGRAGEAREACYQASDLDPGNLAVWLCLAKASLAMGDFPRAVCAAREVLKLDATNADAAMVFGYVLLRDRQADQALAVLSGALTTHPQDATLRCLLGRAYAASGRNDQAKQCYAAALQAEPENVLAKELLTAVTSAKPGAR